MGRRKNRLARGCARVLPLVRRWQPINTERTRPRFRASSALHLRSPLARAAHKRPSPSRRAKARSTYSFFFYFFCPLLKKQKKTKADLLDCDGRRFGRFLKKKNKKKLITCSQVSILIRFRLVGTGSPTTRRIPRLIASRRR